MVITTGATRGLDIERKKRRGERESLDKEEGEGEPKAPGKKRLNSAMSKGSRNGVGGGMARPDLGKVRKTTRRQK